MIDAVANGDYGIATEIAKRYNAFSPNPLKSSFQLSEKQAYAVAKTAVDNGLVRNSKSKVVNYDELKKIDNAVKSRQASEAARKQQQREAYNATYKKSTTGVRIGSVVKDNKGREGRITKIITKSTGYVEVTYPNGGTSKQMAFNLYGSDGNPLKKKPNK